MSLPKTLDVNGFLDFDPQEVMTAIDNAKRKKSTMTNATPISMIEDIIKDLNIDDFQDSENLQESFKRSVLSFAKQWDDINGYPCDQKELAAVFNRALMRFESAKGDALSRLTHARTVVNVLEEHYLSAYGPKRDVVEWGVWATWVYKIVAKIKHHTLVKYQDAVQT